MYKVFSSLTSIENGFPSSKWKIIFSFCPRRSGKAHVSVGKTSTFRGLCLLCDLGSMSLHVF